MLTFQGLALERTAGDANERTQWFRLCTPKQDDHGTVILPEGADLERFSKNPVFLWMHSSTPRLKAPQIPSPEVVIGRVIQFERTAEALDILVEFDTENDMARICHSKVKRGFLRGVSIGFQPLDQDMRMPKDQAEADLWGVKLDERTIVISKWELLEASLVIIPSNQDALKLLRALGEEEPIPAPVEVPAIIEERAGVGTATGDEPEGDDDGDENADEEDADEEDTKIAATEVAVKAKKKKPKKKKRELEETERQVAVTPPTLPPSGNVSNQPNGEKKTMSTKMHPEHRWISRSLIGAHMRSAEGHMQGMAHCGGNEAMSNFHKEEASRSMEAASRCAANLRDAMGDGDDDEGMLSSKLGEARSITDEKIGDADLRAKFNEVAKAVHQFDMKTSGEIAEAAFGTRDSDIIDAKLTVMQDNGERLRMLNTERRMQREDANAAERETVLNELLDKQLITPASAKKARDERWSLVKVGAMKAEAEKAGPIVEIVKVRDLRSATGTAPTLETTTHVTPDAAVTPPQVETPVSVQNEGHGVRASEGASSAADFASGYGLNPEKVKLRFAKQEATLRGDHQEARRIDALLKQGA